MGILTILGVILILVFAIWVPLIGVPLIIGMIILGVLYYLIKGGTSLTKSGIRSITSRPSPSVPGEATDNYCSKCNTRLLKIPNEEGFWCTTCKSWYE